MKGRNNTWTDTAAAAAFAAVLGISAFWGQHDRAYDQAGTAGSAYGRMYNQAGPADEDGGSVGKAGAYPGTAGAAQAAEGAGEDLARTGGKDAEILPDVTESQKAVLDKIINALETQDLETAAQVMDSGEEELVTLFYEVMDGARYLYDGRSFSQSMEGEVTYTTLNQEGETSTWKLEVKDGTVQLDDRWIYIEERGEYQLMSQEDDSHAYIMDEKLADQPVWINLLAWEE